MLQVHAPIGIIESGARATSIASGFKFAGSPVWTKTNALRFSDIGEDALYEIRFGKPFLVNKPAKRVYGMAFDGKGRLISCLKGGRTVVRSEGGGKYTTLSASVGGKKLNGPSDLAIRSDGMIFFTDSMTNGVGTLDEIGTNDVYRIDKAGTTKRVATDFAMPNGIALSPNQKKLYVSDTRRHHIRVFDVTPTGDLKNDQLFVTLSGELPGVTAGVKVDSKGNIYASGPGGVQVFDPTGSFIGLIFVHDSVTNFCFGERDRKTLYITGAHSIYKIKVLIPGL